MDKRETSIVRVMPPQAINNGGSVARNAKYTKNMPKRLRERYEELLALPGYVRLQEEIALITLRVEELQGRVEDGDSISSRQKIVAMIRDMIDDVKGEEIFDAFLAIKQLTEILKFAQHEDRQDEVNRDIAESIKLLSSLKEIEVKRMVAANQVLTVTESVNLIRRAVSLSEEFIPDLEKRARFIRELHGLLERKSG